jgi:hypothetical protein
MALYYSEIKKRKRSKVMPVLDASHPDQIVRQIAAAAPRDSTYEIFVVNNDGFGWHYVIEKKDRRSRAELLGKLQLPAGKDKMSAIKAGNLNPSEVFE